MPNIFVPREIREGETRVAAVPETVQRLMRDGFSVTVESGAGVRSMISDEAFQKAGASSSDDPASAYAAADIVLKLHPPTLEEAGQLREGSLLVSHVWPFANKALCEKLMERRITVFAMDQIPRTTKAQYMDALSSQMNLAGYKAVIMAAERLRQGGAVDDDGGRHHQPGQGGGDGCRRRRSAGDRHRQAPRAPRWRPPTCARR